MMVVYSNYFTVFNNYLNLVQLPTLPPNIVSFRLFSGLQLSLVLNQALTFSDSH